jgi:uncharacterized protein YfaS (alpha-2-macroglobulin family)
MIISKFKRVAMLLVLLLNLQSIMAQKVFEKEWLAIDKALSEDRKRDALDLCNKILLNSDPNSDINNYIKATLYKQRAISTIEENNELMVRDTILQQINSTTGASKALLQTMLADYYFQYYANNSYDINQRKILTTDISTDYRTWDAATFMQNIIALYNEALLKEAKSLQNIATKDLDYLAEDVKSTDIFLRPTLYDLLAHKAISFFSSEEHGLADIANKFSIKEDGFLPTNEFIQLKINTQDQFSFKYQSLLVYQELVRFRLQQNDANALVDAELMRLSFVSQNYFNSDKQERYRKALLDLNASYPSADVEFALAQWMLQNKTNALPVITNSEIVNFCKKTISSYPKSNGAKNCQTIITQITNKNFSLTSEDGLVANMNSKIHINYKNIEKLYFTVLRFGKEVDYNKAQNKGQSALYKYLNTLKVEKTWEEILPKIEDYNATNTDIKLSGLPVGKYIILASTQKNTKLLDNQAYSHIIVKSQTLNFFITKDSIFTQIHVVNRYSGKPIKDALVELFKNQYNYNSRNYEKTKVFTLKTNDLGIATFNQNTNEYMNYLIEITYQNEKFGDKYIYGGNYYNNFEDHIGNTALSLFTDRAIYRPGQNIFFKGILYFNRNYDYNTLESQKVVIKFNDANGQKVSSQELITNKFGSFSGSFVAPTEGLMGSFSITTEYGSTSVQIEEYKRPKFEAVFNPIDKAYNIGDMVLATGKATTFAGAPLDGATVSYTVKRTVQIPWWCGWWYRSMPQQDNGQIVLNGTTITQADGSFEVPFTALPDLSIDKKSQPSFTYEITADVVDINGETHSTTTTIRVGYIGIDVTINEKKPWQVNNENHLNVNIKNLNGQEAKANASIQLFDLIEPSVLLKKSLWGFPNKQAYKKEEHDKLFPNTEYSEETNRENWAKGTLHQQWNVEINGDTSLLINTTGLKQGYYMILFDTKDEKGNPISIKKTILVNDPNATKLTPKDFLTLESPSQYNKSGNTDIKVGTSLTNAYIYVIATYKGKSIYKNLLLLNDEIKTISLPLGREHRGGVVVYAVVVNDNRLYEKQDFINIPFSELSDISMSWSTFRDKLYPGQKEKWILKLKGASPDSLELLATMYDASLDQFLPHGYNLGVYYPTFQTSQTQNLAFINSIYGQYFETDKFNIQSSGAWYNYPQLIDLNIGNRYYYYRRGGMMMDAMMSSEMVLEEVVVTSSTKKSPKMKNKNEEAKMDAFDPVSEADSASVGALKPSGSTPPPQNLPQPTAIRTNFNETAFFFPQVHPKADGTLELEFTMPEALTRWKFLGLSHTPKLQSGYLESTTVTQKDLMVVPNVPRFLRHGDTIFFTTKINNLSESDLSGFVQLKLSDATNDKEISAELIKDPIAQVFIAQRGKSAVAKWMVILDDKYDAITYEIQATSGLFSDGERATLPVLSNRMLITESMPLWLSGKGKKTFTLNKLKNNTSSTLKNHSLTLEYTPNPVWYAVQALPYIMEYPYECAEQLFSRYYANTLGTYIAKSNPNLKKVFEKWQNSDALISNLEKNQELKNILLEESPWVRAAQDETEQKKRIALLFDYNKMANEQESSLKKLLNMQTPNGGFTWFPGMRDDYYITLHILSGLGHLDKLKVIDIDNKKKLDKAISKAIDYADKRFVENFEYLKKNVKDYDKTNHLSNEAIQFMYMRTFYNNSINGSTQEALNYCLLQAEKYWNTQSIYMKAMLALAINRNGNTTTAQKIIEGFRQTAVYKEEFGMYWKELEKGGWYWYQAPIETQALLIEAFSDVAPKDVESIQKMKIWLLKQKQTTHWATTKSTTEAIYALLLQGNDWISSENDIKITLGKEKIDMKSFAEPGTGYTKMTIKGEDIKPEMATVTLDQKSNTPSWGALYWQYFEQIDKITSQQTGLQLTRNLYKVVKGERGEELVAITTTSPIMPGDKVIVRMELRTDRNLEYVHLKDLRAAGFEPENVISTYKFENGLGYYESTKDVATHFFIDYMKKGVYVFEYALRATIEGNFSGGTAQIECMYAPEFKSHSEGIRIKIGK